MELFETVLQTGKSLKTPAFRFCVEGKHFKNGAFGHDIYIVTIILTKTTKTNPNWQMTVAFLNFSGAMRAEKKPRFQIPSED